MAAWHEATLGAVCDEVGGIIQTGPFGSQLHESDYSIEGVPVVMPKDIIEGRISTDGIARVSTNHAERLSRHKLRRGDIVYGRRGDIGRQALITQEQEGWMCGTGCLRLSLGESLIDPLFLHYYLRQKDVISWIANQAIGATLPNLNTGILRSVPLRFPSLAVQRRIAGVLWAYDELIENNHRSIRILEDMVQALYREWFVQFRYPGYDNSKSFASSRQNIPDHWEVSDLESVCVERKGIQTGPFGSQLHESDYAVEGVPLVMPKNLIGFHIRTDGIARIPEATAEGLVRHRMQPGDIVYGRRGDIGRRAYLMPHQAGWFCGTGCLRIRPNSQAVNGWYLFNYLGQADVVGIITGRAQGVTMPNLNTSVMASVPVKLPPRKLQDDFARLTFPMSEAHEALTAKTENLRRTQDMLLPRLLSGQLKMETN
jgi:type I restriction enzyme, S subunit